MNFLNDFGVQPILLLAQVLNFLVLLLLLNKFLYKPILGVLNERKRRVAQSLKDAEVIEKRLEALAKEKEKVLNEAGSEARDIIQDATKSAGLIIQEAQLKATQDMEKILEKGKKDLELERQRTYQEIKNEISDLVVLSLERVVGKVLTEKDKKELIEKSVKNIS